MSKRRNIIEIKKDLDRIRKDGMTAPNMRAVARNVDHIMDLASEVRKDFSGTVESKHDRDIIESVLSWERQVERFFDFVQIVSLMKGRETKAENSDVSNDIDIEVEELEESSDIDESSDESDECDTDESDTSNDQIEEIDVIPGQVAPIDGGYKIITANGIDDFDLQKFSFRKHSYIGEHIYFPSTKGDRNRVSRWNPEGILICDIRLGGKHDGPALEPYWAAELVEESQRVSFRDDIAKELIPLQDFSDAWTKCCQCGLDEIGKFQLDRQDYARRHMYNIVPQKLFCTLMDAFDALRLKIGERTGTNEKDKDFIRKIGYLSVFGRQDNTCNKTGKIRHVSCLGVRK